MRQYTSTNLDERWHHITEEGQEPHVLHTMVDHSGSGHRRPALSCGLQPVPLTGRLCQRKQLDQAHEDAGLVIRQDALHDIFDIVLVNVVPGEKQKTCDIIKSLIKERKNTAHVCQSSRFR